MLERRPDRARPRQGSPQPCELVTVADFNDLPGIAVDLGASTARTTA